MEKLIENEEGVRYIPITSPEQVENVIREANRKVDAFPAVSFSEDEKKLFSKKL